MERQLLLPNFGILNNKNPFTGSVGAFNYTIVPDGEKGVLCAKVWYGMLNCGHSQIKAEESFPLTPEGYAQLKEWLSLQWAQGSKQIFS